MRLESVCLTAVEELAVPRQRALLVNGYWGISVEQGERCGRYSISIPESHTKDADFSCPLADIISQLALLAVASHLAEAGSKERACQPRKKSEVK